MNSSRIIILLEICMLYVSSVGAQSISQPPQLQAKSTVLYATRPEEDGAIVRLPDSFSSPTLPTLVSGVRNPTDIVSGPDARLYFNELVTDGAGIDRIWRIEQDGQSRTLVWQWNNDELRPGTMAFAPNGDLYFGTVSTEYGKQTEGVWRIAGAANAQTSFNAPEQLLTGDLFTPSTPTGNLAAVSPYAFIPSGRFAGDLLIVYSRNYYTTSRTPAAGTIVRALAPSYTNIGGFIALHEREPDSPDGLAIDRAGDVYVSDPRGSVVLQYGPEGNFRKVFANLPHANQITISSDDTFYITNAWFTNKIVQGGVFIYHRTTKLTEVLGNGAMLRGLAVGQPKPAPPIPAPQRSTSQQSSDHSALLAALITAIAAIIAALIAKQWGHEKGKEEGLEEGEERGKQFGFSQGLEQGSRHSMERLLDIQRTQLEHAEDAIRRRDYVHLKAIASAIVATARQWRKFQSRFQELLNGQVDRL